MITFILGTRPEIIKCMPVILEIKRRKLPLCILHSGQHYSWEMDRIFFDELKLPKPDFNLEVGSLPAAKQIGVMIEKMSNVIPTSQKSIVVVQGDTNTVLAGAITANKMGLPIAHLEAGLRSGDYAMPEESNRIIADCLSDLLFCPTENQADILRKQCVKGAIHIIGNTIVDAVNYCKSATKSNSAANEPPYALLTIHRPSNVDEPEKLKRLILCINEAATSLNLQVIFPIHPRTLANLTKFNLLDDCQKIANLKIIPPLGYSGMIKLMDEAAIILTDSGGIQEEANILHVPCVTLRENTERPETIEAGGNMLYGGTEARDLENCIKIMLSKEKNWPCPFGDGTAAVKAVDIMMDYLNL